MVPYLAFKDNDLGRPVVQHKPLHKGEYAQASIVKVFDDPGMRPRVIAPMREAQPSQANSSMARGLCTSSPAPPPPPHATPCIQRPTPSSAWPWSRRDQVWGVMNPASQPAGSASPPTRPGTRDLMSVADIEGACSKPSYLSAPARLTHSLDLSDIPGSRPGSGWKLSHRPHASRKDAEASSSAANSPRQQQRPADHSQMQSPRQQSRAASASAWTPTASQEHLVQQQQQQQQQQQACPGTQPPSPDGPLPVPEVTGLQSPSGPGPRCSDSPLIGSVSVGAPAGAPSAELARGAKALEQLVYRQQARMQEVEQELQAARLAQHTSRSASAAQGTRVAQAEARYADRRAAAEVMERQLEVGAGGVRALQRSLQAVDRERCGRVTVGELAHALDAASVRRTPEQMLALVAGLQDQAGLLDYRRLLQALAAKSSSSSARSTSASSGRKVGCAAESPRAEGVASGAPVVKQPAVPYRTIHHWFGGALLQQEEVPAWKPGQDADAMGRAPPTIGAPAVGPRSDGAAASSAMKLAVPNTPTVCFLLKTGQLDVAEVGDQLKSKLWGASSATSLRASSAATSRAQQMGFASTGTGGCCGTTLKGALNPVGTWSLQVGSTASKQHQQAGVESSFRPASAAVALNSPRGAGAGAQQEVRPVSAVDAGLRGGSNRDKRMQRATLKAEVAAVRTLV